nr:MAG TPA: hypothetical protein [Caudoviricetes sp.]
MSSWGSFPWVDGYECNTFTVVCKPPSRKHHIGQRVTWVGYFVVPTIYIFFFAKFL